MGCSGVEMKKDLWWGEPDGDSRKRDKSKCGGVLPCAASAASQPQSQKTLEEKRPGVDCD